MTTFGAWLYRSQNPGALCLALAVVGCEAEPPAAVTVTDSAGVRITLSRDTPRRFAEVDSEPVLSLGGPEATGPTQFFRIQNIHLDPRGALWVADGQSGEVRIFHEDGSHWKTIGGRGQGPGEFQRIRLLGSLQGDSVAVWDDAVARVTLFDANGELIRTARIPPSDDPLPRAFDVFSDGSLLAQVPRVLSAGATEPGEVLDDTVRLIRVDLDKAMQYPQGRALGPLWLWTGRSMIPIPFTINAGFDVYDAAVHLVAGPDFRVRVFEGGRLSQVYGVARGIREVTQADIVAYREFTEEFIPEAQRNEYLAALAHPRRPSVLPAYSRVVVAADGDVWAQIYSPDFRASATWDVFSQAREWLGQVETPASFMVMSIDADRLVGVWRDDFGVEHLRVYPIRPG